jgi:hypothetical protein
MTTEDLEQLADLAVIESSGMELSDMDSNYTYGFDKGYKLGFKKALELVFQSIKVSRTHSDTYAINRLEEKFENITGYHIL